MNPDGERGDRGHCARLELRVDMGEPRGHPLFCRPIRHHFTLVASVAVLARKKVGGHARVDDEALTEPFARAH